MIAPTPPAGSPDRVTRLVADRLSKRWGQPVVVENRAGATTMVGTEYAIKQPPDGYTLLSTFTSLVQAPALFDKVPYDWERDLVPITQFIKSEVILLTRSDSPWKTLPELLAAARAGSKAGKLLSYGSFGNGSSFHIYGEALKRSTGIDLVHVPYKGEAQSLTDLLGGQINVNFNSIGTALPHLKSGKVRALALVSSVRSKAWPEVPTFGEVGVANLDSSGWFGLFAPAGTPRPIVERIAADVAQVLAQPDVAATLREQGLEPVGSAPDEFAKYLRVNAARWKQLAQENGIRAER
jgi:tripartite-type tricarboxylate transporter receptor subunit TctC